MDIKTFDNKIIKNYLTTLERYDILTIPTNLYLRKPYIERYIIEVDNIADKYDELEIDNNDFYMYIYDNISLNQNEKKILQNYIINDEMSEDKIKLIKVVLTFVQSYFKYYMIITELLYEKIDDLYDDIFSFVNNDNENINYKIKNNFNFQIFYYYTNKLYNEYELFIKIMINNGLLENKDINSMMRNLFIKNLFSNWYAVYKKNGEPKVIKREKSNKRKILSRLFCVGNIN
jgi:hypothetical protein